MNQHPIAVVAARTGLTPDVLRAWERRYAVVVPARAPDGQRMYSDADVRRLRLLRLVTEAGRSISHVAGLPVTELEKLVEEDAAARPARRTGSFEDALVHEIIDEALSRVYLLDAGGLDAVLHRAATIVNVSAFLEKICAPVLHQVGEEWHEGRITVAHEHLASSVIEHRVMSTMRGAAWRNDGPAMVVATPAGERHGLGAALAAAAAAAEGWRVVYLGSDLPADDIVSAVHAANARVLALSIVSVTNRKHTLAEVKLLRDQLDEDVKMIVGGAGSVELERDLRKLGVDVVETLTAISAP